MSRQKQAVLSIIKESKGQHLSADDIFQECQRRSIKISLATVYRNLASLSLEQQIRQIHLPNDIERYDSSIEPHAHLVCMECGKIEDVDLSDVQSGILDLCPGRVQTFDLALFGLCKKCAHKHNA